MNILQIISSVLDSPVSEKLNRMLTCFILLFCSLFYLYAAIATKYATKLAISQNNDSTIVLIMDELWVVNLGYSLFTLLMWHYFAHAKVLKKSIVTGVFGLQLFTIAQTTVLMFATFISNA